MKRLMAIALSAALMVTTLAGCGSKGTTVDGVNTDGSKIDKNVMSLGLSEFNMASAQNDAKDNKFEDIDPIYNVHTNKEFEIKLPQTTNDSMHSLKNIGIEDNFKVYRDADCTQESELVADVEYNEKTNTVAIKPDSDGYAMYSRKGVDDIAKRAWGGLQTYYLVI